MQTESSETGTSQSRFRRAATVIALVLLAIIGFVWFCIPPKTNTQPVSLQKDAKGRLQRVDLNDAAGGLNFEAQAGSLKSNNSVSTSASTTHSSPAFFAERSMMIVNYSEHLLMQRIGDGLLDYLQKESQLDRIDYFPFGHDPPSGERAPDLFVVLDLAAIDEAGILGRDLRATVHCALGSEFQKSNYSVSDSYSPPKVELYSQSTIEHSSSLTGVESSAAKYRLQGQDIAQQVGKAITEKLKSLREDHKALPALPDSFYPAWTSMPEFKFLTDNHATLLTSLHGLCYHNESFWLIPDVTAADSLLEQVHTELTLLDWTGDLPGSNEHGTIHLRMSHGPQVLEVFHVPHRHGLTASVKLAFSGAELQERMGVPVYIRFRDSMTIQERHDAYAPMLAAEKSNVEQLVALRRLASQEQRQQLIALIQQSPPQLPDAWLMLAEQYSSEKRIPELEQALRAVYILSWCQNKTGKTDNQIRKLCRKHKLDEKSIRKVDFEQVQSLGLPSVTTDSAVSEQVIHQGESAIIFVGDSEEWKVVSVALGKVQKTPERSFFDTTVSQSDASSRSSMTGTQSYPAPQETRVELKRMKVTLSIEQESADSLQIRVEMATE